MTVAKLIEFVYASMPYAGQIKDLDIKDLDIKEDCIYFTWRETRYKVTTCLEVYESKDGMLIGSDCAILMRQLLKSYKFN